VDDGAVVVGQYREFVDGDASAGSVQVVGGEFLGAGDVQARPPTRSTRRWIICLPGRT